MRYKSKLFFISRITYFLIKTTRIFRYLANASLLKILRFHCFLFGRKRILIVFPLLIVDTFSMFLPLQLQWLHFFSASINFANQRRVSYLVIFIRDHCTLHSVIMTFSFFIWHRFLPRR